MQNIDPVYLIQPIIAILLSVGLVLYWHRARRRFTKTVLLYSLLAYAGAIAVKAIVQAATYPILQAIANGNPYALGAYFGVQTVVFEVGGAFLAASLLSSRNKLCVEDAEGYGLSLGMWENAGLLGVLGLLNLITIFVVIASGGTAAESLSTLSTLRPDLFYPPAQALPLVAYGILERVSSLLVHVSWGILVVLAACLHKRGFLLLALPMGMIDFFVPFANNENLALFELSLFAISLACLGVTLYVSKKRRQS